MLMFILSVYVPQWSGKSILLANQVNTKDAKACNKKPIFTQRAVCAPRPRQCPVTSVIVLISSSNNNAVSFRRADMDLDRWKDWQEVCVAYWDLLYCIMDFYCTA